MPDKIGTILSRIGIITAVALLCVPLCGCWDYKSLDELTIVAGIAIDRSPEDESKYLLSFEIVNSRSVSEKGAMKSTILQTEGKTIFEAVYNSRRELFNYMYLGNAEVLAVSSQIAESEGIQEILDTFLRDNNTRDTIIMLISREETAGELIAPGEDEGTGMIKSYEIANSINSRVLTTSSVKARRLTDIYNTIKDHGGSVTLPAFKVNGGEKGLPVACGMAVFGGDRLSGYLEEEDVPYYMLATSVLGGGAYGFSLDGENSDRQNVSVTIKKSAPKLDFTYAGGELALIVDLKVSGNVNWISPGADVFSSKGIADLESRAGETLSSEIKAFIQETQTNTGRDIFEFGPKIYQRDPRYWDSLSGGWEEEFRNAAVIVNCDFSINNTGMIKRY